MPCFRVEIVRFVDEWQPGVVECQFTDAFGRRHAIVDKVPMFTADDLWTDSSYPQPGVARCRILERMQDKTGRELVRVTVSAPDGLEMLTGESEIVLLGSQILEEI